MPHSILYSNPHGQFGFFHTFAWLFIQGFCWANSFRFCDRKKDIHICIYAWEIWQKLCNLPWEKNASNETSQIRDHQIMYKRRAHRQLALIVLENAHKMPNANGNILQVWKEAGASYNFILILWLAHILRKKWSCIWHNKQASTHAFIYLNAQTKTKIFHWPTKPKTANTE